MNTTIRNILAVVAGIIIGSIINMSLVMVSGLVIPPPPGVDTSTAEGLKAGIHLFELKHFLFPFLAHALGALSGGFIAAMLGATHRMKLAIGIGVFFLLGGITAAMMIPAPMWFIALDLIGAYIPMGWLAGKLAAGFRLER